MIKEFQGKYRWLSNFWMTPVKYKSITYPSAEHAYMSAKYDADWWKALCSSSIGPGQLKVLSRSSAIKVRPDWHRVKIKIMYKILKAKFKNEDMRKKLKATGKEHIQEGNRWNDTFWGVCLKTGKGENTLGELIMKVRNKL